MKLSDAKSLFKCVSQLAICKTQIQSIRVEHNHAICSINEISFINVDLGVFKCAG